MLAGNSKDEKWGDARHVWDMCAGADGLWGMVVIKILKVSGSGNRAKFDKLDFVCASCVCARETLKIIDYVVTQ